MQAVERRISKETTEEKTMLDFAKLLGSLPGGVAQGLIWGIMAIGVYLTYRCV